MINKFAADKTTAAVTIKFLISIEFLSYSLLIRFYSL